MITICFSSFLQFSQDIVYASSEMASASTSTSAGTQVSPFPNRYTPPQPCLANLKLFPGQMICSPKDYVQINDTRGIRPGLPYKTGRKGGTSGSSRAVRELSPSVQLGLVEKNLFLQEVIRHKNKQVHNRKDLADVCLARVNYPRVFLRSEVFLNVEADVA